MSFECTGNIFLFCFVFAECWTIMTGVRWHHHRWAVTAAPPDSWRSILRFTRLPRQGPTTSIPASTATTIRCPSTLKSSRYVSGFGFGLRKKLPVCSGMDAWIDSRVSQFDERAVCRALIVANTPTFSAVVYDESVHSILHARSLFLRRRMHESKVESKQWRRYRIARSPRAARENAIDSLISRFVLSLVVARIRHPVPLPWRYRTKITIYCSAHIERNKISLISQSTLLVPVFLESRGFLESTLLLLGFARNFPWGKKKKKTSFSHIWNASKACRNTEPQFSRWVSKNNVSFPESRYRACWAVPRNNAWRTCPGWLLARRWNISKASRRFPREWRCAIPAAAPFREASRSSEYVVRWTRSWSGQRSSARNWPTRIPIFTMPISARCSVSDAREIFLPLRSFDVERAFVCETAVCDLVNFFLNEAKCEVAETRHARVIMGIILQQETFLLIY